MYDQITSVLELKDFYDCVAKSAFNFVHVGTVTHFNVSVYDQKKKKKLPNSEII